jgi:hypothetical protein
LGALDGSYSLRGFPGVQSEEITVVAEA